MKHPISAILLLTASVMTGRGEGQAVSQTEPSTSAVRLGGPTSVQEELAEDRIDVGRSGLDQWNAWKDCIADRYGLNFSFEYNALGQVFSSSAISEDAFAGGNARFFGSWTLLGKDTKNPGSLVFRVDNRHRYTELDPQNGSIAAGSALPTGSLFSGREWGMVNLQWSQTILDGRAGFVVGMTPADDYFHAYAFANPLTTFSNLAFSTGGEIAVPDTGFGLAGGGMLNEHFYVKAGVHDANGDSTDPNLDVFGDWELYKNLEIGWSSSQDKLYLDNFHIGLWHVDARTDAGAPESWGIVGNASWYFEDSKLLLFLRGGWSDGRAALLNGQVSTGIGKQFRDRDLGGVGLSWGSPAASGTDDQWTGELFYRFQMGNVALTPSLQVILNPTYDPSEDSMVVGSMRARVVF